jgi:CHASE1-domain containing sensor protein
LIQSHECILFWVLVMQIHQLSAAVDTKLRQLDKQLEALTQEQASANGSDNPQLARDIAALTQIRHKLVKSHDLALKAHQLERATNDQHRARQRLLGLVLCGVSLLGGVALLAYIVLQAQS